MLQHQRALREADVVFAGGRTLHRNVAVHRRDAWLFPSGVEPEHYNPCADCDGYCLPCAGDRGGKRCCYVAPTRENPSACMVVRRQST